MSVEALTPRVAHVAHALIEAGRAANMPVTAAEVMVYDEEALTVRHTGAALAAARRAGLAIFTGRYWTPTFAALDLRLALEDRYLREVGDEPR